MGKPRICKKKKKKRRRKAFQGQEDAWRERTKSSVTAAAVDDTSRLCHRGRYRCLLDPRLLFLHTDMQELSEPAQARRRLTGSRSKQKISAQREGEGSSSTGYQYMCEARGS